MVEKNLLTAGLVSFYANRCHPMAFQTAFTQGKRRGRGIRAFLGAPAAMLFVLLIMEGTRANDARPDFSSVPGVVIHHSPAKSGIYLGSPGIVRLSNGDNLAKCDEFGPQSSEYDVAVTRVFRSGDRGKTWEQLPPVRGIYWASIFTHGDALYLMGPHRNYGHAVIMRSSDGGRSWTAPRDANSGLLLADGPYHCAPVPTVVHDGRIWRGMEFVSQGGEGGARTYQAFMMSAPEDADLLKASSWTCSNRVPSNTHWLNGKFTGWLEGNAVVSPAGDIVDILRVNGPLGRLAAMVRVSADGKSAAFEPATDFIDFPGGAKKFTIRHDSTSGLYWSLTNYVLPRDRGEEPGKTRNTLALISSPNLNDWNVNCIMLHHSDVEKHAFQYVDWIVEGHDLLVASRTAYDDGLGGAHNAHDANFLTFHRVKNFRTLTRADDVSTKAQHPEN